MKNLLFNLLILHLFGQLMGIEDTRHAHLDASLLFLGLFQFSLALLKIQIRIVVTCNFLQLTMRVSLGTSSGYSGRV